MKGKSAQKGFTLIEIVIAIAILAVILGTAYATITQILNAKRFLDDKRDVSFTAYSIIGRLSREFQLTVGDTALIFTSNDPNSSASGTLNLLGQAEGNTTSGFRDSVTFVASEGGQYLPDGGTHTGLVQITYRVAKDPEKGTDNQDLSLIREEVPYATLPNTNNQKDWEEAKEKAFSQRMVFPVTENVVSFHLNYYDIDNEKWLRTWDEDKKGTVPALIHFNVVLRSPLGEIETYSSMVPIGAGLKK